MGAMMKKYEELESAGWDFSHNENGSIIMQLIERSWEHERVVAECEITQAGEVRDLPRKGKI